MKTCFKCNLLKPLSEYYKHSKMADGYLGKCKDCTRKDTEDRRKLKESTDPVWVALEAERHRLKTCRKRGINIVEYSKRSSIDSNGTKRIIPEESYKQDYYPSKEWARRNPEKKFANMIVGNAIRDGKLLKKPCEICGELKVDAHHDNYLKPLEVRWLCRKHHSEFHRTHN